jgi:hypothetical protein
LLGFQSEFPIRQLEKAGQLRAVRGAMRQAWYARAEVMALASPLPNRLPAPRVQRIATAVGEPAEGNGRGRWTDSALIALLREGVVDRGSGASIRPPTAVDLVAETGISITRATRVYRFWLVQDVHPTAALARGGASRPSAQSSLTGAVAETENTATRAEDLAPTSVPGERRGSSRIERDGLIRKLRDPDPAVRARAFEKLKPGRNL